ncbi:AraC family transcriptional regulator [Brevundimonas sp. Root1279]|uniref:AraC family transcriptional regulator n=1 Tax=Brevundimonas sp. Root1279 TaxID=1736443 RepID=UPI0009E74383|nr:AraC family transcriptional regulator [Brevundimonas sp. Root1279]
MSRLHELAAMVRSHLDAGALEGAGPLLLPGLQIIASTAVTEAQQLVYEPMLCVILEGAKNTTLGAETHPYRAGQYLVVSADLPVSGQVIEAPYLAIGVPLDPAMIAELLVEAEGALHEAPPVRALAVSDMDDDLIDTVVRLVRLLDRPQEAAVVGPMVRRELMWRLLNGERADMMRQIGAAGGRLEQVRRAIRWLRQHYAEPMRIERLAEVAGMSETSLHRHFKAVTAMSPLQYQKQIRLQEARNLLLARGRDVAGIGFTVGYDSPSQFSREYSRLFGQPPGRDLERLKADPSLAVAV